jgi:hypothetical protein
MQQLSFTNTFFVIQTTSIPFSRLEALKHDELINTGMIQAFEKVFAAQYIYRPAINELNLLRVRVHAQGTF